jgi:hypothetical protein
MQQIVYVRFELQLIGFVEKQTNALIHNPFI